MARPAKPLTNTTIKNLKCPPEKANIEVRDGNGLLMRVTRDGTKTWYFLYNHPATGKRNRFKIGRYPDISLSEARERAQKLRQQVSDGIDPKAYWKARKAEQARQMAKMTFGQVAEEWYRRKEEEWSAEHAKDIWHRLNNHLLPLMAGKPIDSLAINDFVQVLKRIEKLGLTDMLSRILQYANQIMRYAVTSGYCSYNPLSDLDRSIFKKRRRGNYPHVKTPEDLQQVLRAIETYHGGQMTRAALQLQAHIFLRPRELTGLLWEEVRFDEGIILIEASRMKKKRDHIVPMSTWVRQHLEALYELHGELSPYVFPSPRTLQRPISEQTLNPALHRMGFKDRHTAHGFRHTASTMLHEMGYNRDWIEMQLAHFEEKGVRATYNKAEYLPDRRRMMEAWSRYLEALKHSDKVVPLFREA